MFNDIECEIVRFNYEQKDQIKTYSNHIKKLYKEINQYCKKTIYDELFGGLTTKTFSFDDNIDVYDFNLKKEDSIYFIINKNKNKPLVHGYVRTIIKEANEDVGKISQLECLFEESRTMYRNNKFQMISRESLKKQNGFKEYTGKGKLLHIGYMEFFNKLLKLDTTFFNHIQKSNEFEIIETEFYNEKLLVEKGFQDTEIYEHGEDEMAMKVFVWNNPLYKK
jgi:hypothetical protein